MRDVCLVLSSGAARGLAHIGAIGELERRGYRVRSVVGCSMGALVGGMYAAGRLKEFEDWMHTVNRRKMFSLLDLTLSFNHLVKGDKVIESLKEIVPDVPIESLPMVYRAVATDWENGKEVEFSQGSLYEAIRASISIPGFFCPVPRGKTVLVDGAVLNPLPLKQAVTLPGELLVAVNVSGPLLPEESSSNFNYLTMLRRTLLMMQQQTAALTAEIYKPDVLVDIPMNLVGSFDFDRVDDISALGRERTQQALDAFEKKTSGVHI